MTNKNNELKAKMQFFNGNKGILEVNGESYFVEYKVG